MSGLKAEALVKIVSKREPPTDKPKEHRGGLVSGYEFDSTAEPKQRVRFDRASNKIIIATQAPSVAAYLDESGKGSEKAQGQVLLAELISESVCREISRRGVENVKFLAPVGAETDAMQREYIRLKNLYAHRIHSCLVDPEHRRDSGLQPKKRGRPSREESLANRVTEV